MTGLAGVRVLVTGGTSGLGWAMAQALVQAGARVALTSREPQRARDAAARLGRTVLGVELDVRDGASVEAALDQVDAGLGGVDVLINNAGIGMSTVNPRFLTESLPFWEVPVIGFRDVLEIKVTGSFLVARASVPRMLSAGGGRVVTISMSESTMVRRGFTPYGPSGAAGEAFARIMAADLTGTPVTANVLLPGGATATGMVPDGTPERVRARLLDPSIMGPPIVWLCSEEAADVHDQRIVATQFDEWLQARSSRWEVGAGRRAVR